VEADGAQHYDPKGKAYDQRRSKALRAAGFRIIRFSDYDILKDPDAVQRTIYRALTEGPELVKGTPTLTLPRSTGRGNEASPAVRSGARSVPE